MGHGDAAQLLAVQVYAGDPHTRTDQLGDRAFGADLRARRAVSSVGVQAQLQPAAAAVMLGHHVVGQQAGLGHGQQLGTPLRVLVGGTRGVVNLDALRVAVAAPGPFRQFHDPTVQMPYPQQRGQRFQQPVLQVVAALAPGATYADEDRQADP